jgi:hypothetical protein
MAGKNPEEINREASPSLADDQIVTERTFSRRSFLTATGALLAGAVALAAGVKGMAQEKGSDPDSKKGKKKGTKKGAKKGGDPDKKKKKTAKPSSGM